MERTGEFFISEEQYIQKNYLTQSDSQIGKHLNRSRTSIKYKRIALGLFRKNWLNTEVDYIQDNWQTQSDQQLADFLGRSKASVVKKRLAMGLPRWTKTDELVSYIGHEGGKPYNFIQVQKNVHLPWSKRYIKEHVLNWEKLHGKIPKGKFLRCRSGNTLDARPENWTLVDRSTNIKLNENRTKASSSLKDTWNKVKIMEANGLPSRCGLKSQAKPRSTQFQRSTPFINRSCDFNF